MSGAIESLHLQYPGAYLTDFAGTGKEAYAHNPRISNLRGIGRPIRMENPLINCSHLPVHFLDSYCLTLSRALDIPLTLQVNRPHLYLSNEEKTDSIIRTVFDWDGPYWVVCSTWKNDYTVKRWKGYQAVVDMLEGKIKFVQVGERHHPYDHLDGVLNLRGRTNLRELIRVIYHSSGVLCGETCLNHIAAGLQRPCVCLLSGFLPRSYVSYFTTTIISRQGMLDCCLRGACWKSRVEPLHDGDTKDNSLCVYPERGQGKCMNLIDPGEVVAAIGHYDTLERARMLKETRSPL
jgi:hypothetical protein